MIFFNAVQLVVLFSIYPFVTRWVQGADFYGASVLFWVLVIGYFLSAGGMVYAVAEALERDKR